MIVTIHQPEAYGGYVGLIQKIAASDLFIIYDSPQFEKNNYQNRNQIRQFDKAIFTSIPIELPDGHLTRIKDVIIKDDYYKIVLHKLRKQLSAEYSKCPFYEDGMFLLENTWSKEFHHLSRMNSHLLTLVLNYLGIPVDIKYSSDLDDSHGFTTSSTEHLVDLCLAVGATTYLSGQGGKNYMDESLFMVRGIDVEYFQPRIVPYPQMKHKEFIPYLCILDGIFNHGKNFINYIKL